MKICFEKNGLLDEAIKNPLCKITTSQEDQEERKLPLLPCL